jgi:hypothetical protein
LDFIAPDLDFVAPALDFVAPDLEIVVRDFGNCRGEPLAGSTA